MPDQKVLNPGDERAIAKVRRLMVIIMTGTFVAIALVLVAVGYRLFHAGESAESAPAFADVTETLPAGAKVIATAVSGDHIVVTIEVNGATELRTFDPDTLKPLGRLRLVPKP
jgi:hypothetical protein